MQPCTGWTGWPLPEMRGHSIVGIAKMFHNSMCTFSMGINQLPNFRSSRLLWYNIIYVFTSLSKPETPFSHHSIPFKEILNLCSPAWGVQAGDKRASYPDPCYKPWIYMNEWIYTHTQSHKQSETRSGYLSFLHTFTLINILNQQLRSWISTTIQ